MRNMSFALTTRQFQDGSKTVTRRLGWKTLKPGTRFMGVRKAMGLKPGEKIERLGPCEVVSNRPERLDAITPEDVEREGFPGMTPAQFVAMFCEHMGCEPGTVVNRIEFKPVDADWDTGLTPDEATVLRLADDWTIPADDATRPLFVALRKRGLVRLCTMFDQGWLKPAYRRSPAGSKLLAKAPAEMLGVARG